MLKTFNAASLLAVASLGLAACDNTADEAEPMAEDTTAMEPAPVDTATPLPGDTGAPMPGDTASPTGTASPTDTATPTM
jgi:hypothetical protein